MNNSAQEVMRAYLENMVGEGLLAKSTGLDTTPAEIVNASFDKIVKVASEDIPIAHMRAIEAKMDQGLAAIKKTASSQFRILFGTIIAANLGIAAALMPAEASGVSASNQRANHNYELPHNIEHLELQDCPFSLATTCTPPKSVV